MTREQQDILIAKIVDCPKTLTAEDIAMIGQDPELMDLYEVNSSLRGAYQPEPIIDIDHEWEEFTLKTSVPHRPRFLTLLKVAAAIAGVAIMTGLVMMVVGNDMTLENRVISHDTARIPDRSFTNTTSDDTPQDTIITEPVTDAQSPMAFSHHHSSKPTPKSKTDVDEMVRLAVARIENESAVKIAQIELAEQLSLRQANNELHTLYPEDIPYTEDNPVYDLSTADPDIKYSIML